MKPILSPLFLLKKNIKDITCKTKLTKLNTNKYYYYKYLNHV